MEVDIISLLSTDGYIMCNKTLIKLFGGDCAILVGELCAEYNYYKAKGELTTEDSFYSTQENIEENTGLNAYQQRKALTVLKEAGIITVSKQGLPAKNYYFIDKNALIKLFTPLTTSALNFKELEVQNLNINNNKTNNSNTDILSKDNIYSTDGVYSEPKTDVSSKAYTEEDFLGSAKRRRKPESKKTSNLYRKCMDEINKYTGGVINEVHVALTTYLSVRLSMKDKPIYGVNQWIGILKRLDAIVAEDTTQKHTDIINQSIQRGWATFFPVKSNYKKKEVFSEYGQVNCDKADEEDIMYGQEF